MKNIADEITDFKAPKNDDAHQLIEEIINIGHGIYEKPSDDAIDQFSLTEAEKNKNEWTELSKNNEFIARYNPYIKENFNKMSALDIYRAFSNRIKSYANIPSLTQDEFTEKLKETKELMIQAFENNGINVKDYHDFIERFNEDCIFAINIHLQNNNEYTYQVVLTKNSEDLSYILENKTTQQDIENTAKGKIAECLELGIPKNDIISIIISGFENFIIQNGDKIDLDILISVLNDLTIENESFTEIMPDFNKSALFMVENAMREFTKKQKSDAEKKYFTEQLNRTLALKEFLIWYKSNKNAYPDEINNVIRELLQKYSIAENSFLYLVLEQKFLLKNSQNLNVFVITQLERMSLKGELQTDETEKALIAGYIGLDDALRFIENLEKPVKSDVLKIEKSVDDGIFNGNTELLTQRAEITIDLAYEKITLKEAQTKLLELLENSDIQTKNNN